jgi:hypothetical protein
MAAFWCACTAALAESERFRRGVIFMIDSFLLLKARFIGDFCG